VEWEGRSWKKRAEEKTGRVADRGRGSSTCMEGKGQVSRGLRLSRPPLASKGACSLTG